MASDESKISAVQLGDKRVEYESAAELLKQLNASLSLIAPRVPVLGSSPYRECEAVLLSAIESVSRRIELQSQFALIVEKEL